MANDKKVRIYVSRKITLERHGKDAVVLTAGANTVDRDVAEHPFVKAHTTDAPEAAAADAAAQAKIAELLEENAAIRKANDEGAAQLRDALNRAEAAEAKVAEQSAIIKAYEAAAPGAKK